MDFVAVQQRQEVCRRHRIDRVGCVDQNDVAPGNWLHVSDSICPNRRQRLVVLATLACN